jgi:hypothetical protein
MSQLTNEQQWLVNLSGPLAAYNKLKCDSLEIDDFSNEDSLRGWRSSFKRDWGVATRQDLEKTLAWLADAGHRMAYRRLQRRWGRLSESALESQLHELQDKDQASDIRLVHLHRFVLRDVGISAWDYGRYAFLCRQGYYLGLFSEDEAWQAMRHIATGLRDQFKDWPHYGISYAVGQLYWAGSGLSQRSCREVFEPINRLLGDPQSGWNRVEWREEQNFNSGRSSSVFHPSSWVRWFKKAAD